MRLAYIGVASVTEVHVLNSVAYRPHAEAAVILAVRSTLVTPKTHCISHQWRGSDF